MSKSQKNTPARPFGPHKPNRSSISGNVVPPVIVGDEVVDGVVEDSAHKATHSIGTSAHRASLEDSRAPRDASTRSAMRLLVGALGIAWLAALVFGMSSRLVAQGGERSKLEQSPAALSAPALNFSRTTLFKRATGEALHTSFELLPPPQALAPKLAWPPLTAPFATIHLTCIALRILYLTNAPGFPAAHALEEAPPMH